MKRRWVEIKNLQYEERESEYIRKILESGQKIRPILVLENKVLDGNKRCTASLPHRETIEAFVCTEEEYGRVVPHHGKEMRIEEGGQSDYSLFEETESEDEHDVHYLSNHGDFRIEVREWVHVHWGHMGQYRLDLGRRDFLYLAEAVSQIDI